MGTTGQTWLPFKSRPPQESSDATRPSLWPLVCQFITFIDDLFGSHSRGEMDRLHENAFSFCIRDHWVPEKGGISSALCAWRHSNSRNLFWFYLYVVNNERWEGSPHCVLRMMHDSLGTCQLLSELSPLSLGWCEMMWSICLRLEGWL